MPKEKKETAAATAEETTGTQEAPLVETPAETVPETEITVDMDHIPTDPADLTEDSEKREEEAAAALAAADAAMEKEFGPAEPPAPTAPVQTEEGAKAEETAETKEPETVPAKAPRDFNAEFAALIKAYPELYGKGLPDELVQEIRTSDRDVLSVYDHHMVGQLTKKVTELETELARARQNAETAARAPVIGSVGSPDNGSGDPFLDCFNRYFG